ncbi:MAG: hypothetical protein ACLGJB_08420 [Blastocatellia bacterium]
MATRNPAVMLLILALITGFSPNAAHADGDGGDADTPIRLYASERFGPVGVIRENSPGSSAVVIDGRACAGERMIWGGELIEAPSDRPLHVSFDSVGEVTIGRGAVARFTTSPASPYDAGRHVLVASVVNGGLNFKLERDSYAYVEAAGSSFTASRGSRFRVSVVEGLASVETIEGAVTAEQQPAGQRRYILRPVAGQGATLSVSARSTRQVQIQVTDENDRPVPDLPLLFSLGSPCLGSLGIGAGAGTLFKEKTDRRGIASVPWVAGAARCKGAITVKVEGTDDSFTYQSEVSQPRFWTARNSVLVGAAAAAAGIGIVVVNGRDGKEPITPVPPPEVRP